MRKENNKKIVSNMYNILQILAIIVAITGISMVSIYNIHKTIKEHNKDLEQNISEICDEIEVLNLQLMYYTSQKEYMIINGVGNKATPAILLDYRPLIAKMEDIHNDYYFIDLITYMKFCGYNVEEKDIRLSTEWFFRMEYEQQAEILSQMFMEAKPITYKLVNKYEYYADITGYGNHIEYSNIRAEADEIEERVIQIFICTQISNKAPFGLTKITNENKGMIYPKMD